MDWFYVKDGQQVGPVAESEIRGLVAAGTIDPGTLVWTSGMTDWRPWSEAQPGAGAPAPDGVRCSRCGRTVLAGETIQYGGRIVCATCKPAFVQELKEGAALPGTIRYGGFWIRLLARLIDAVVLWLVNALIQFPLVLAFFGSVTPDPSGPEPREVAAFLGLYAIIVLIQISVSAAYEILFLGRLGATPGKLACRLKVVTSENRPITYGRALGRFFGNWLSGLTFGIGYIIAAFDDQKRSLHDRICDTRVVKV